MWLLDDRDLWALIYLPYYAICAISLDRNDSQATLLQLNSIRTLCSCCGSLLHELYLLTTLTISAVVESDNLHTCSLRVPSIALRFL